jgi:hypothetical protein
MKEEPDKGVLFHPSAFVLRPSLHLHPLCTHTQVVFVQSYAQVAEQ